MRHILKIIFIFCFVVVLVANLSAQVAGDFRSVASGTWATIANWQRYNGSAWVAATAAPVVGDNVITIQSPNTINIAANLNIDQVVINLGGTLNWTLGTFSIANGAGVDLQINGTMWDNRNAATPSVTFAAGATWQMGAAGTLIRSAGNSSNNWQAAYQGGISTIPSTAFWILRKTTAQNPTISTTTPATGSVYPNLTIENNTGTAWVTATGSTFTGTTTFPTVKGNLDIGGAGTNTVNFLNQHTNATPTQVVGNVTIRLGSTLSNNGTGISIGGNIVNNGTVSYDSNDGRLIEINGTSNQQLTNGGTFGIFNFEMDKPSGTLTLNSPITVDNVLTMNNGIMFTTGTNLLTLNTNASVAAASDASFVSGPVRYIGLNAMTFPVGKGTNYQALGISATAGGGGPFWTENFNTGAPGWTLNVVTGAEGSDPNYFMINDNETGVAPPGCGMAGGGDPSLHVGSVFNPPGGAAYDAGGLCGFFFCPETNRRTESPTINCTGFSNISVNFDYIEGGETTNDDATLWYFDGVVWAPLDNMPKTIVCGSGQGQWTFRSVPLPASANNNPLVKIAFRWVNNDDGVGADPSFAVDDVNLSVAGPTCDFTCEYFNTNPQVPYGATLAPGLLSLSNCEYWILNRNAGTVNKFVTLNWDATSCLVGAVTDQRVARHDGISTWQNEGASASSGTVAAGSVTSNLVTSFSPFTLGSIAAIVLPVELLVFEAIPIDNSMVRLNWSTATESNNDKFELERSKDGINFEFLGFVKGAGNSSTQQSYLFSDFLPYAGISYYRLKQVDFDGKYRYSDIKKVNIINEQNVQIYPNPNNGNELFINLENLDIKNLSVNVTDGSGKIISSELSTMKTEQSTLRLNFPTKLAQGFYLVNIKTGEKSISCRLIVN